MDTIYDSTIPRPIRGVISSQSVGRSVNITQVVHNRALLYGKAARHFANAPSTSSRLRGPSPLEELGPRTAQVSTFLKQFPQVEAILPEAVTQTRQFFRIARLRLELDDSLAKPVLLLVCETHMDAISALEARQELMKEWWLKMPSEVDAHFDFHLAFATEEAQST